MIQPLRPNLKTISAGIYLAISLMASRVSIADTLEFSFSGVVTSVNDPNAYVTGLFHQGEAISGSVAYLSTAPDQPPYTGSPTIGYYFAVEALTVQVGPFFWKYQVSSQPSYLQVWHDLIVGSTTEDGAIFGSGFVGSVPVPNTGMLNPTGLATLSLISPNVGAIATTAIPTVQSLEGLVGPGSIISVQQDDSRETLENPMNFSVQGTVTSVTQVPTPASGWLMAWALAPALGFRLARLRGGHRSN